MDSFVIGFLTSMTFPIFIPVVMVIKHAFRGGFSDCSD